jgi:hypothetical protein
MYRVNEFIDGRKCNLAVATFETQEEAEEYVIKNNGQPGGNVYGIDPQDFKEKK